MTMAKTRINVDSFACTRSDVLNYVNKSPLPCVWRATSFSILREEAHPPHPLSIIKTGTYQRENSSHMCPERHNYLLDWPPLPSHHQVPGPQRSRCRSRFSLLNSLCMPSFLVSGVCGVLNTTILLLPLCASSTTRARLWSFSNISNL